MRDGLYPQSYVHANASQIYIQKPSAISLVHQETNFNNHTFNLQIQAAPHPLAVNAAFP